MSATIVEPLASAQRSEETVIPECDAHQTKVIESEDILVSKPQFSNREREQFREDDAAAGRTIATILCTLFSVSLILALIVIAWTFSL